MVDKIKNDFLTEKIIACCFKVHNELGPGFNEKIYQNALRISLRDVGLKCALEENYNVTFQGHKVGNLKIDLLVNDKVIAVVC